MEQDKIGTTWSKCGAKEEFDADCSRPVPEGFRKYCAEHSRLASQLWKRRERARWARAGQPYYLDRELRETADEDLARALHNARMAAYMRERRRKKKGRLSHRVVSPREHCSAICASQA